MTTAACVLCDTDGGLLIHQAPNWRLIRATDTPAHPAFYRVVWNAHMAELSDLGDAERHECMEVVTRVERLMRQHLQPTKINLAALGNMVPHLHWHVIARYEGDSHFPAPIWAAAQREPNPDHLARVSAQLVALDNALAAAFQ